MWMDQSIQYLHRLDKRDRDATKFAVDSFKQVHCMHCKKMCEDENLYNKPQKKACKRKCTSCLKAQKAGKQKAGPSRAETWQCKHCNAACKTASCHTTCGIRFCGAPKPSAQKQAAQRQAAHQPKAVPNRQTHKQNSRQPAPKPGLS